MDKKMTIETLKDASQLAILFAALLYFLGFLTVNSFLARFGIVSFDVINARYLIAGILCLLPLSAGLWIAWHIGIKDDFSPFNRNKIFERILIYVNIIFWSYLFSIGFATVFNAAKISTQYSIETLHYKSLGKYDLAGNYLNFLDPLSPFGFIIKFTINISILIILFILILYFLAFLFSFIPKKQKPENPSNQTKDLASKDNSLSPKINPSFWIFIGRCSEAFLFSLILSVFIYSFNKIRIDIFDFNSFKNTDLSQATLFAWLFVSVISANAIIFWTPKRKGEQLQLQFSQIKPDLAGFYLQAIIAPIFASIFLFGQTIFPRIPYMIGGGEPREVSIQIKNQNHLWVQTGSIFYLIGESSQFLYVVSANEKEGKAFQINKNEIELLTTKIGSGSTANILNGSGSSTPLSGSGSLKIK